jgi:hypothetical protein
LLALGELDTCPDLIVGELQVVVRHSHSITAAWLD